MLPAMDELPTMGTKLPYLLTAAQMQAADAATIASGVSGYALMQRAGEAVVRVIEQYYEQRSVLVLAGLGNNGGDGYIVAQQLHAAGWSVRVASPGGELPQTPDALRAAKTFQGCVEALSPELISPQALIVDALFGTGLVRPITGELAAVVERVNALRCAAVAVDIPSGVDASTGVIHGVAIKAELTVTFAAKKRGHLLMPGLDYCGGVVVSDIGILVQDQAEPVYENTPEVWAEHLVWPQRATHKYHRGHVAVMAGDEAVGASRLAALSALRAGAGLCSLLCERERFDVYASAALSLMVKALDDGLEPFLMDERISTYVIGPGAGTLAKTRNRTLMIAKAQRKAVIDADALRVFSEAPAMLFSSIVAPTVLTPHEGEFATLFANTSVDRTANKLTRTQQAAVVAGAAVVLKGADTVIAAPDGRAAISGSAPAWLATAGSGDVLAGCIAGFLAQGMPAFEAACAGVWFHSQAAQLFGPGLIAEDLPQQLPAVWQALQMSISVQD